MRHHRHGEHGKPSLKIKRIKNIAATLHQPQKGTDHSEITSGRQSFSNTEGPIFSDVLGSYTGMTYDDEAPVQDADDL